MDVDYIRSRCIRILGGNNQSHIIDVGEMPDASAIRNRIFQKFNIKDINERSQYGLYIPDSTGRSEYGKVLFLINFI